MEIKVFGITNCDTVKKAINWLKEHGINYQFIDLKKEVPDKGHLTKWCRELGWDVVLNKKGTTWRKLSDEQKNTVHDIHTAVKIMTEQPTIIKRPVIETEKGLIIGFDNDRYQSFFG